MSSVSSKLLPTVAISACAGLVLAAVPVSAQATNAVPEGPPLARDLVRDVDVAGINRHLTALQRIADVNDGTRAASTAGHVRSAEYVASQLEAAGYAVTRQEFPFVYTETIEEQLTVAGSDVPVTLMEYSPPTPEGGISAPLSVVEPDDTPGCEAEDYGDVTDRITLVQRGSCSFGQKQIAAAEAGAVGALIYNTEDGELNGTLGDPADARIPTGGISQADGEALAGQDGAEVTIDLRSLQEERTTYNVIAETKTGRKDNAVMAGAHLDSVPAGPGVNDNGSGSATLLETALQLGGNPDVNNAVRFGFWGAEEFGLVGSQYYVDSLSFEDKVDTALYMNYDMLGSPNAAYLAYDGDDSDGEGAGPGPYGSAQIEATLVDYLGSRGIEVEGTDFDGRSDYGGFIAAGIPSGGLFSGAEGIKTPEQAEKWGGEAGVAYDPCYHQACDTLGNIDRVALDRNADGVAWALGKYAISTEEVNGVSPTGSTSREQRAQARAASTPAANNGHAVAG